MKKKKSDSLISTVSPHIPYNKNDYRVAIEINVTVSC